MSSPTGSPFAEVIQSLAGLHQEHHKALMDMRADQERRFCALVQNQREDRELLRSWMDREVRARESSTTPAPPTHMPVQKMGPQDDPEAFLDLFEKTAAACGWPQTDWPVRLIPLLTAGSLDLAIQLAEDQMVACHGVGETLPSVSLSLPSPFVSPPIFLPRSRAGVVPRAQPRWRGGPAPESTAARAHGREAGSAGPSPAAGPVSSVSPRQFLVPLPATGVAGKPGPACWRCGDPGHFIDRCPVMEVGTLVRVPDVPQAAPDQPGHTSRTGT